MQSYHPVGDSAKNGPAGLTMTSGNNRKVVSISSSYVIAQAHVAQHIFDNVKLALKRLQTDYIDVLAVSELFALDWLTYLPSCSSIDSTIIHQYEHIVCGVQVSC